MPNFSFRCCMQGSEPSTGAACSLPQFLESTMAHACVYVPAGWPLFLGQPLADTHAYNPAGAAWMLLLLLAAGRACG